jgi:hypothetical protein
MQFEHQRDRAEGPGNPHAPAFDRLGGMGGEIRTGAETWGEWIQARLIREISSSSERGLLLV